MATGRVEDARTIHRAIRLPGARVVASTASKHQRKLRTMKDGKVEVYQHGKVVSDPNELDTLAAEGKLNMDELKEQGVISGW